jgi:hypothetical protein
MLHGNSDAADFHWTTREDSMRWCPFAASTSCYGFKTNTVQKFDSVEDGLVAGHNHVLCGDITLERDKHSIGLSSQI